MVMVMCRSCADHDGDDGDDDVQIMSMSQHGGPETKGSCLRTRTFDCLLHSFCPCILSLLHSFSSFLPFCILSLLHSFSSGGMGTRATSAANEGLDVFVCVCVCVCVCVYDYKHIYMNACNKRKRINIHVCTHACRFTCVCLVASSELPLLALESTWSSCVHANLRPC